MPKNNTNPSLLASLTAHVPALGTAPKLAPDRGYVGYYCNEQGGQLVFVGDRQQHTGILHCEDDEGRQSLSVTAEAPFAGRPMSEGELGWLLSCLVAISGKAFSELATAYLRGVEQSCGVDEAPRRRDMAA